MNSYILGDALTELQKLPDGIVNTCITSPPYWGLRDYGVEGQLGLEATPEVYVARMVALFREVRRVLRKDGTLWLNIGDSYASRGGAGWQGKNGARINRTHTQTTLLQNTARSASVKAKDMIGIPWMLAFALRDDGWYLRQEIIWAKPNPMPESAKDRCTKAHESLFLLSKSSTYYWDREAMLERASENTHARIARDRPENGSSRAHGGTKLGTMKAVFSRKHAGEDNALVKAKRSFAEGTAEVLPYRNKRSVWMVGTQPFKGAHFATFPPKLIEPCVRTACPPGGMVLDPFLGAGTTAYVAKSLNRRFIGIELNAEYLKMAKNRVGE